MNESLTIAFMTATEIALREEDLTPRQFDIVKIVSEQGYATLDSLAQRFGVSTQSVRRDLITLDRLKILQRFHGGAGPAEGPVRLGYGEKRGRAAEAKARIGRTTAALIPDGASVFLDVGTTVEAVAKHLRGRGGGLRVFTTSLATGMLLAGTGDIEVHVFGGTARGADGSLVGAATVTAIKAIRFDLAVIGFSGVDHGGTIMDFDLEKIAVKQAAMARADRTIAVGDQSKFARRAVATLGSPDIFSMLVTDAPPPPPLGDTFDAAHLDVVVA